MPQAIKSFVCNEGLHWHYYDCTFWTMTKFMGRNHLMACTVDDNGLPEIEEGVDHWLLPNACDVEDAEQHHLDFVNKIFNTNFILTDKRAIREG